MDDNGQAAGSIMFMLITVIYFVILGWILKIGLWIFGKGWNAAAIKYQYAKGFLLMLLGITEITSMIFIFWVGYKTKHAYLGNLQPAIEAYYLHWLLGSLSLAIMALLFTKTKRVQSVADEIRATL